jgi:YD repeat-containing protein
MDGSTRNVYDENGNLIETVDALGNSEHRTVDRYGRVTSITDRARFVTRFEYAQLIVAPTKVINPDESFRTFVYNQFGQATSVTDELGHETTVDYNPVGLPVLMVDALGATTSFTYDASAKLRITATTTWRN